MALTASDLIDDAKVASYPFVREENISPAALLRHLTSLEREIVTHFSLQAPDRLSTAGTNVTIVKSTNPTGYILTAAKAYTTFKYIDKDSNEWKIEIAPEGKRPSKHPAAFVRGSTFFPIDPFELGWDTDAGDRPFYTGDADVVSYRYIAEPAKITAMTQTLVSPDEAEPYIVAALRLNILLMYGQEVPAERLQDAMQMMILRRQLLLYEMIKRTGITARFGEE